jgi:hypothetical protein
VGPFNIAGRNGYALVISWKAISFERSGASARDSLTSHMTLAGVGSARDRCAVQAALPGWAMTLGRNRATSAYLSIAASAAKARASPASVSGRTGSERGPIGCRGNRCAHLPATDP